MSSVPPEVLAEWEDQLESYMEEWKRDVIRHVLSLGDDSPSLLAKATKVYFNPEAGEKPPEGRRAYTTPRGAHFYYAEERGSKKAPRRASPNSVNLRLLKRLTEYGLPSSIKKESLDNRGAIKSFTVDELSRRILNDVSEDQINRARMEINARVGNIGWITSRRGHTYDNEANIFVDSVLMSWAHGSNSSLSRLMQKSISNKFAIDSYWLDKMSPDVAAKIDSVLSVPDVGAVFDSLVESIYEWTQRELDEMGLDTVTLYRGMRWDSLPGMLQSDRLNSIIENINGTDWFSKKAADDIGVQFKPKYGFFIHGYDNVPSRIFYEDDQWEMSSINTHQQLMVYNVGGKNWAMEPGTRIADYQSVRLDDVRGYLRMVNDLPVREVEWDYDAHQWKMVGEEAKWNGESETFLGKRTHPPEVFGRSTSSTERMEGRYFPVQEIEDGVNSGSIKVPASFVSWESDEEKFGAGKPDPVNERVRVLRDKVSLNPISSFSASLPQASKFANAGGAGVQAIAVAEVPRERVFSTFYTGMGCAPEKEFLIIGGDVQASVGYVKNSYFEDAGALKDFATRETKRMGVVKSSGGKSKKDPEGTIYGGSNTKYIPVSSPKSAMTTSHASIRGIAKNLSLLSLSKTGGYWSNGIMVERSEFPEEINDKAKSFQTARRDPEIFEKWMTLDEAKPVSQPMYRMRNSDTDDIVFDGYFVDNGAVQLVTMANRYYTYFMTRYPDADIYLGSDGAFRFAVDGHVVGAVMRTAGNYNHEVSAELGSERYGR